MTSDWLLKTFGHGRRTNRMGIIQCATMLWKLVPPRIHQYPLTEALDPWTRDVASGLLHGAEESAFDVLWYHWLKEVSPQQVAVNLAGQVDAVIVLAPRDKQLSVVAALEEHGLPCVIAYACCSDIQTPYVRCDNAGGIRQIVHHLAQLGHRRIGFGAGPDDVSDVRERKRGFLEGMVAEGLKVESDLVIGGALSRRTEDVKPEVFQLLRRKDRPTAIVCATDYLATNVIEVAWELGLNIPQDLAVTGFDDSDEATQIIPQITTVRQPILEIANQAAYLAACMVEGQTPETTGWHLELPVSLVVRESCGASLSAGAIEDGARLGNEAQTKIMRRELELRMRQLAAINQELKELLYVASHDLRTPLVTIQGFASSLERKYREQLDERGVGYLQRIKNSVDNMRELIDTLLTLSRTSNDPLNFIPMRPRQLIERVVHDLGGIIEEKHARITIGTLPRAVLADEVAMYQIFLNLIGNAMKFAQDGQPPEVMIGHAVRDDEYEFFIRDNGVGIAATHQEEIFQVFRRLGESKEAGSGVGLAIVKRMVLRHGGRVWVESQPGSGATFKFTLPRRSLDHVVLTTPIEENSSVTRTHRGG